MATTKKSLQEYQAEYEKLQTPQEVIEHAKENSKKTAWVYLTEKIEYFLNGEMLLYQNKDGRWYPIKANTALPGVPEGVTEQSLMDYPKDPHIITLSNGVTSKALGNPLMPQAKPFSNNDDDVEAARRVTNLLMCYRNVHKEDRQTEGRSMRDEIIELFKVTGCAFIKDYFDPNAGEMVPVHDDGGNLVIDPKTGQPAMRRRGDLRSEVVSGREIGVPNGIKKWADLPWIMHESTMHINKIFEKYGKWVEPDEGLEDTRDQTAWGNSAEGEGKLLEGHAVVYEVYMRPSPKYPKGRMVAGTSTVELFDGVYDKKLADSDYADTDWHPFSFAGWLYNTRKFWPKTPFEHIIPHQINLNKQWKRLLDDDKDLKGWWLNQKGTVDWEMVRNSYQQDGTPNIQYEPDTAEPKFVPPPKINRDSINKINLIVNRANDNLAQYETSRGNSDPNIKSGKQADVMNMAANSQSTPLLTALVSLFIGHWTKEVHLAAVHFDDGLPREIQYDDPLSGEIVNDTFSPDDIKSDDITIYGGNAFYMTPEAKNEELDRLLGLGAFGNIAQDMKARRAYLKQRSDFLPEDSWNPEHNDIDMAKWENRRFKNGQFTEDREYIIEAVMAEHQAKLQQWQQAKAVFEKAIQAWKTAKDRFDNLNEPYMKAVYEQEELAKQGLPSEHPGEPPLDPGQPPLQLDPGPPPPEPEPWWRAKPYENHAAHREEHAAFRKTVNYEKLCAENPDLDKAMDFHDMDHVRKEVEYLKRQQDIVASIMPPPAPPGGTQPPGQGAPAPNQPM